MTIQQHEGSILSTTQGIVAHSCDAESGAHAPLLADLRLRYPGAARGFKEALDQGTLALGQVLYYQVPSPGDEQLIIASAVMLRGPMPDIGAAQQCLKAIADKARATGLPVHFAAIPGIDTQMLVAFLGAALGADIEGHLWRAA